ncbi:hypothetical protein TIFTF001_006072 [Ficus carica]|uniref:Uncharacterized protein n=1 Tax=Ficus carica TaxID=3494 RepID=A0AA88DFC2_FICCA|nr:hypothetical protein TIFTF001_006072 [Ficus carica]
MLSIPPPILRVNGDKGSSERLFEGCGNSVDHAIPALAIIKFLSTSAFKSYGGLSSNKAKKSTFATQALLRALVPSPPPPQQQQKKVLISDRGELSQSINRSLTTMPKPSEKRECNRQLETILPG